MLISVIGFGTIYVYGNYRRYRWFHEMNDCDKTIGTKPRIIVLGTGKKIKLIVFIYLNNIK